MPNVGWRVCNRAGSRDTPAHSLWCKWLAMRADRTLDITMSNHDILDFDQTSNGPRCVAKKATYSGRGCGGGTQSKGTVGKRSARENRVRKFDKTGSPSSAFGGPKSQLAAPPNPALGGQTCESCIVARSPSSQLFARHIAHSPTGFPGPL